MLFKRLKLGRGGGTALAERPSDTPAWDGTDDELEAEIARLTRAEGRDADADRRLLGLRHVAGLRRSEGAAGGAEFPAPDADGLSRVDGGLPEITASDLTPGLLRAGILRDGCLLVRGLIPREKATAFAGEIQRAYDARERALAGAEVEPGYYEEFRPGGGYAPIDVRDWVRQGGGLLAVDSPAVCGEMLHILDEAGLPELVRGYLGEAPLFSTHKTTLRKADPSVPGAWHQDGAFLGDVRALNLWLSLSHCGDTAPGLDLLPKRIDHIVRAGDDEAMLHIQVSQRALAEAAGDTAVIRPIFEPGDALFFDELFLHATGSDPSMPEPRFALESWFFGASAFPVEYAPVAL